MADYLPQASGLWSTTTWITAFSNLTALAGGNTPPTVIDNVYADGKTITVDINTAVLTIRTTTSPRTGGLAGGGFTINNAVSLSANVIAGTTTCLTFLSASSSTCTIVGNISGGPTNVTYGLNNFSTGTITVYGNCAAGTGADRSGGVINSSTGTINIFGNVTSPITGPAYGVYNIGTLNVVGSALYASITNTSGVLNLTGNVLGPTGNLGGISNFTATANIVGNVTGGAGSGGHGLINNSAGSVTNVIGNIIGGAATSSDGIRNLAGIVSGIGTVIGGSGTTAIGLNNGAAAPGLITVVGNVSGGIGAGSDGIRNSSSGTAIVSGNIFGGNTELDFCTKITNLLT